MDAIRIEGVEVTDNNIISIRIRINYAMRYDGLQVNTHVYDAKGMVRFTEVNGKQVSMYRLFISKDEVEKSNGTLIIKAIVEGKDVQRVRIRASIIQEHKEVEYDEIAMSIR
ncbi:hypothetical protein HRbin04_00986 [archaeon HR04]|nr:hypothetical protein HRbin04_00986 [archaeon HR04]